MSTGGAGRHRLEHRQPEALAERRVAEERAAAVQLRERRVGDVAEHRAALTERLQRARASRPSPSRARRRRRADGCVCSSRRASGRPPPVAAGSCAARACRPRARSPRAASVAASIGSSSAESAGVTPSGATTYAPAAVGKWRTSASAVACGDASSARRASHRRRRVSGARSGRAAVRSHRGLERRQVVDDRDGGNAQEHGASGRSWSRGRRRTRARARARRASATRARARRSAASGSARRALAPATVLRA